MLRDLVSCSVDREVGTRLTTAGRRRAAYDDAARADANRRGAVEAKDWLQHRLHRRRRPGQPARATRRIENRARWQSYGGGRFLLAQEKAHQVTRCPFRRLRPAAVQGQFDRVVLEF